jgi:tryptophan synthase alpha chain
VPDLPVDEAEGVARACREAGVDPVLLAAPGTGPERLRAIAALAGGFVYCVATYGVTGEREALGGTAREVVGALRPLTDLPLLVGVGIGTPEQASQACAFADGVIVGSALVRHLDGGRWPPGAGCGTNHPCVAGRWRPPATWTPAMARRSMDRRGDG